MKYKDQYVDLLNRLSEMQGVKLDLLCDDGGFIDERIMFGYIIYALEKVRLDKITTSLQEAVDKGLEEMYVIGVEAGRIETLKGWRDL